MAILPSSTTFILGLLLNKTFLIWYQFMPPLRLRLINITYFSHCLLIVHDMWYLVAIVANTICQCWFIVYVHDVAYQLSISKAWVFSTFWNTCMRSDVKPMAAPETSAVFPVKVQFSKWAKLLRWPSGPSSAQAKKSNHRSGIYSMMLIRASYHLYTTMARSLLAWVCQLNWLQSLELVLHTMQYMDSEACLVSFIMKFYCFLTRQGSKVDNISGPLKNDN